MWKLTNQNLDNVSVVNNPSVRGLELFELPGSQGKTQLFRYQPLVKYGISSSSPAASGVESVVITNNPESSDPLSHSSTYYLYVIDQIWDISNLDLVYSLNYLDVNKYSYFDNNTYILLDKEVTELEVTTDFYMYLPVPNSANQYEFEIDSFNTADIVDVTFSGLTFKSSGTLTFQTDTNYLVLNANNICRPVVNSLGTIRVSKTLDLTTTSKFLAYEFDLSETDIKVATYLEYKGNKYNQSKKIFSGSLLNNFSTKKVYAIL